MEGDLLGLGKEIVRVPIQRQLANPLHGDDLFRHDFRGI
jgi:hypothetical protein